MFRNVNLSRRKQYGAPLMYTIGSSRSVIHSIRFASGCALRTRSTTSSIASSDGWPSAYMFVFGMLRKLIAPRTPLGTLCDALNHRSDLRSVLTL